MPRTSYIWGKRANNGFRATARAVHKNTVYPPTNNLELVLSGPHYTNSAEPDSRVRTRPVPEWLVPVCQTDNRLRGETLTAAVHEQRSWSNMLRGLIAGNPASRIFFHRGSLANAVPVRILHGALCPCLAWGGVVSPSVNGAASADR